MLKAILFDLDGTLLPVDQDAFTKKYFDVLGRFHALRGNDAKRVVDSVWAGTVAMLKNKGEDTNENVFWRAFKDVFGVDKADIKPLFDEFYASDFIETKTLCGYTQKAAAAVSAAKAVGVPVVLATNPIFPIEAQLARLNWAGINPDEFCLVTSYENSRFCKPRPEYYTDIAFHLGCRTDECLMIGNDTLDDMTAAKVGMSVFLITDCLINKQGADISAFAHGNIDELIEFLNSLNN